MEDSHDHTHDIPTSQELKDHQQIYLKAWGLSLLIVALEIGGSIASGSLALLADIGHVFTDTAFALIPIAVTGFKRRSPINPHTIERIGGVLATLFLFFIGYHIIKEAIEGLGGGEGHEHVEGMLLFLFASITALINWWQHTLLRQVSPMHRHTAHSGYHFHVLTDLFKNVLLPILGIAIALGASSIWDLYAALGIGIMVIVRAMILVLEAFLGERLVQRGLHSIAHILFR